PSRWRQKLDCPNRFADAGASRAGTLVERSGPVEQSAQLLSAHSGVVWLRVGLELLPPNKRTDDDGIESRIAHQCRCGIERLRIVAGERDADPIALAMRLGLQSLVVHGVECLHPPTAGTHRGCPSCRTLRMRGRLARNRTVPSLVRIARVEYDFSGERRRQIAREIGNSLQRNG